VEEKKGGEEEAIPCKIIACSQIEGDEWQPL